MNKISLYLAAILSMCAQVAIWVLLVLLGLQISKEYTLYIVALFAAKFMLNHIVKHNLKVEVNKTLEKAIENGFDDNDNVKDLFNERKKDGNGENSKDN